MEACDPHDAFFRLSANRAMKKLEANAAPTVDITICSTVGWSGHTDGLAGSTVNNTGGEEVAASSYSPIIFL